MKKFLSLIALAITFGMASCSDDECDHTTNPTPQENPIVGMWYEETNNEEVNYDESGTYYDRYCNVVLSGETEGRYEFDQANMKLTYRYSFIGQNVQDDFTVKNLSELTFTLSSQNASALNMGKIVEKYKMEVGEVVKLKFSSERVDININSYASKNERIASVTPDGTVTAMGEKGTTYIKIATSVGNVWAKITVGDDSKDIWCDFTSVIGENYNTMKQYFSRLGDPASDGINYFAYYPANHLYIKNINVLVDTEKDMVTAIQVYLRESIPAIEITSYLKSRLYKQENVDFYSNMPITEDSKALVSYNQEDHVVTYLETQSIIHPELWQDFTKLFGSNNNQVKAAMDKYDNSFLMTDYSYSKDGSDYYSMANNDYAQMVGYVFNPDKQVSEFWVYLNTTPNMKAVYDYLSHKYTENESESTTGTLVFYNTDGSIKVTLDRYQGAVVYTKVTMKQHEAPEMLGEYHKGIGMTHDDIISNFGTPLLDDNESIYYMPNTQYIKNVAFTLDNETKECKYVTLIMNENIEISTIVNELNSKYTVFEKGTPADGSQYTWTNGATMAESSMGIIYVPTNKTIKYQLLKKAN